MESSVAIDRRFAVRRCRKMKVRSCLRDGRAERDEKLSPLDTLMSLQLTKL